MRTASRLLCLVMVALTLGAAPSPSPTPEPVFEIHRTEAAQHVDPAKANPIFALVIGSDMREGDPALGRADTLQIVAVNTQTGHGTIVGIPRDSWVPIPGRGADKINAALHFGGPELMARTVHELTGIPIHYWVLTEFTRFRQLVDHLGGLDIEVPIPMLDPFSGADFPAGPRHVDGAEALAFARNRHIPDGDFARSANAQRLLVAGLARFREQAGSPAGLLHWLAGMQANVVSNVPLRELIHLGVIGRRIDPANLRTVVLPGSTGNVGRASVVFLAPEARSIFDAVRDDAML